MIDTRTPLERLIEDAPKGGAKYARFVEEYVIDFNGQRAATAAGFATKQARRQAYTLLQRPDVKAALAYLMEQMAVISNITAEKVRVDIETTRRLALSTGQLSVAAKCSELQGRSIAMFIDKVEHNGNLEIANLSESELNDRINNLITQIGIGVAVKRGRKTQKRK